MKRIFTLLIIATMFAISSLAYDVQIDGIYYNLNDETKTAEVTSTSGYNKYSGDITIPEKITYNATEYSVTSIGQSAFSGCLSLTSITIPNSVTSIGNDAFYYCSSLTSITIPNSVTSIGYMAFYKCSSLTSISIPNSVTSIRNETFSNCSSLTSITIGNSVTSIGECAFSYCSSLTSITIPNSVTSIGERAFYDCSSLASITIGNSVTSIGIDAFWDCSSLTSISIPNSVTSIAGSAFSNCSSLTSIEVDANNPNYASIDGVLYDKDVTILICCPSGKTSITIPNSVTSIGYEAFYDCSSLTSITIPNSVTSIGNSAFFDCSSLTSITIPNSVTSIGYSAFQDCSSLTSITIPNSVTYIEWGAFQSCSSLTSITIPNSVTSIGDWAFSNCSSLTSINIEATIPPTIGGANTFNYVSKNIPVTVPCGSLSAYQSANYWSEFTNYVEEFPFEVSVSVNDTTMGNAEITNQDCANNEVTLTATPNDDYRFVKWSDANTENPRTITVVEDITLTAEFVNDIIASGTCGDNLTWQLTKDGVLTISGTGVMYDYASTTQPWNSYKQQIKTININDGVTSIGGSAFYRCSSLTSITIPNSVTSIGGRAFYECSSLTSITIPNSVTYIGNSAFEYCYNLTSITIPNSVTSIRHYVFSDCSSLTSIEVDANNPNYASIDGVLYDKEITTLICYPGGKTSITIPNSVTSIGDGAFASCSSLTSISIPNSVTSIGYSAFFQCKSLTSITIPNSVTSIVSSAFQSCSSLTSIEVDANNQNYASIDGVLYNKDVTTLICCPGGKTSITIPNSVTSIGDYAFCRCLSLTSITIPNSVTSIGNQAFESCSSLTSITIPNSITSIGIYAFYNCSNLTSINIEATIPPTIGGAKTFNNVSKNIPVTVPCGSLSAYQSAEYWSEFTNYVEEFPYTFSATTADVTMGSVTIETAPACGVDAVIKAIPNAGYRFVKWSDGNTENPRTITVAEDITLTAEFANDILASGTCGDNLTWKLTFDSVLTISGTGVMYDYNLSDQPWNSYKQQIKTININDGVTSIGNDAFYYCDALTSITIPNSVTSIGEDTFYGCSSLTSISIPNSVTSIGDWAFSSCSSLTSISIPNSVTSIGNYAFNYCYALTSITIPNSVTSIGEVTFYGCSSLTSINVKTNNQNYASIDGVLYNKEITTLICCPGGKTSITIPNSVTSIGDYAFSSCSSLTSITIPNSVTSIGDEAFYFCSSLTSITIPNSVTSIGNSAFRYCSSLTSISIPNSVTSIGNWAFADCSSLTSITIPNSVTSIGNDAFRNCSSLTSITIPNSVTSIGNYAFYNCSSLTSINIEATIPPTIGVASTFNNVSKNIPVTVPCGSLSAYQSANYWSEFTNYVEEFPYTFSATTADATMGSVTIETAPACGVDAVIKATPNNDYRFVKWSDGNTDNPRTITVTEDITLTAEFVNDIIASGTCGDNLTWKLTFDSVLTISGTGVMYDYTSTTQPWNSYKRQIKTININDGVTSIGNYTFSSCSSLTSITIPNSVTSIGEYAFEYCRALTSITIPNSVTSIGKYAFSSCSSLTSINWNAKKCNDFSSSLYAPFYYIRGQITSFTFGDNVEHIPSYLCYDMNKLTSITIPNSVTSIGDYAFNGCSSLTSIEVDANNPNYASIDGVLYNKEITTLICCPGGKTSISIPNSVTSIGERAFYECSSLTSITIPNSVTSIGKAAFRSCSSLTSITIPNSVTSIGEYAFEYCRALTSITIPNSVTSIGKYAFSSCSSLTSITIPNSVTSIGNNAFSYCSSLTSITIPNSVTSIESGAFSGCSSLTSITIPNSVTSIGYRAFEGCSSLTSITIGNSVTSIGNYAFSNCSGLTSINIEATIPPTIGGANTFNNVSKNIPVTVPCGSLSAYQSANYWNEFTNYVEEFPYTFSATTADATIGSVTIETAPACGVDAVIKATPNDDYRFVKWSDGNTENPRTITVAEDITLTAIFEVIKFHVSVTCNNPTMGMVLFTNGTNDTDYKKGATVSFVAITNSGYLFNGWSDGVKDVMRTIEITQDTTITALFGTNTCSLTLNADETMGSVTGSGTYTKGTTATIIATPNAGYRFVKWSDGNTNATRSIVVNEDMTLSAIFEKIPTFTINVTANAQMGSATGGGTFEIGKTTTLSAIANEGYHFVKWSDGVTTNPRNITITENLSLEAIFEALYPNWSFDDDKPSSTEHTFLGKEYYDTITIVAGKTITIEDNAIIACNDIIIKADENGNVPEIKIEGDIIANNGITFEWEIDDSRWYFFTLPFNCKIRDVNLVTIANGPSDGVWNYYNPQDGSGDFIIRDYNQKRAAQGQGKKTGWVDCEANKMLHKGRGYIIGLFPAGSKAKVQFKSEKQIQLSKFIEHELDFGEDHSWYDYAEGDNQLYNGWNLVGVPYFETFSQGDLDATYVSIPNDDGTTYTQHTLAEALTQGLLRPFMSFFIQLAENVAPTFDPTDRSNAPMLRAKQNAEGGEIVVNILKAEDEELCDRTTIINNTSKTNDYEIGYDLQKMIGYAAKPQIYTIEECGILAFNAQDVLSSGIVRLGFYIPADGEYVIGGESWGKLSGAELYDNKTGVATSLTIPQTIYFTKGTYNERFEIRVKQQTTTDADVIDNNCDVYIENGRLVVENMPQNGNVYVYDSAGKLIHEQTTNSEVNLNLVVEGVYNITICTEDNRVFNTKVVY